MADEVEFKSRVRSADFLDQSPEIAEGRHSSLLAVRQTPSRRNRQALRQRPACAYFVPSRGEWTVPGKASVDKLAFNADAQLPFELRISDFEVAMNDVYDFFADVNALLSSKGLHRLDDMMRPAALSGLISDMMTASLAKFSRSLVENRHFNGHPDLILRGKYANDAVASGTDGVEIKSTRKAGGAVDTHGARQQWMCVFVYEVDNLTEPAANRAPMRFTEVYLGLVTEADFRSNARSALGTRTATLHAGGIKKLRTHWVYKASMTAPQKTGKGRLIAGLKPRTKKAKPVKG